MADAMPNRRTADDIPVAHTPKGGYGKTMPPAVLEGCTDALAAEAPDFRGLWRAFAVEINGKPARNDNPLRKHTERIEQAGDRVVITAGGVIHDMRVDGSLERGVDDVSGFTGQRVRVAATFEGGRLVLHPGGVDPTRPGPVTRELRGETLVWSIGVAQVLMRREAP